MPFNLSGVFERLYSWVTDRDNSVKINAPRMDAETDGIVAGINAIVDQTQPFINPVKVPAGTASLPSVITASDPNTGQYFPAADQIAWATGGTQRALLSTSALAMAVPARFAVGSAAAPSVANSTQTGTGILFPSTGTRVGVSILGTQVAEFAAGQFDLSVPVIGTALRTLTGFAESVGGTANAITVDMPVGGSLITGMSFRFIPASQNTGATTLNLAGTGVKSCVTISGAGLPAAYLRTGIPTTAHYNGTYWVLDREPEYGSNANGEYWRYASGLQVCRQYVVNDAVAWSTADGSLFRAASAATWTFPAPFVAASTPSVGGGIDIGATPAGVNFTSLGASSVNWYPWSAVSRGAGVPKRVMLTAINNWY